MYTKCNKCGAVLEDPGEEFKCPKCGTVLKSRTGFLEKVDTEEKVPPIMQYGSVTPFNMFKALTSGVCLLAILAYTLILFLSFLVFLYAIPLVGSHWPELEAIPFLIIPYPAGIAVLEGQAAAAYWGFISLVLLLSFYLVIYPERNELKETFIDSARMLRAPSRSNDRTFFMVAQMFLAILFFDLVYYNIIEWGGATPDVPPFGERELWDNLYGFANASVWEEIVTRLLLIGAPLLVFKVLKSANDGSIHDHAHGGWRTLRRVTRILWGGFNDFSPIVVGLIVFSALMFGFAHAPGWDMWKVLPTAVSGLGFGYLYVKKGLHAAILLHFSFNYLDASWQFLPANFGVDMAILIILLMWVAVGLVYFVHYGAKVVRFFIEPEEGWDRPAVGTGDRKVWDLLGWK